MKLAIFTDTFYPEVNGVVNSILNFSGELTKKGHSILVFCPTYKHFKEIKAPSITVHRFFSLSLSSYKEVRVVLPDLIKIFGVMRNERPDIIHIHAPGPMGCVGILCSKIFKIPCVGTCHTLFSEQLMYLSFKKLLKIENLISKVYSSKLATIFKKREKVSKKADLLNTKKGTAKETIGKNIVWRLYIMIYNNCDLIIAPSNSIKKIFKEKGIKRKIIVISCGVNTKLFYPKIKYAKKIRRIIHVGRISFEKNIDRTIKAFFLISRKYDNIQYTIIGSGPALNSLKHLSKKMGLNKQLKFLGYIPHNKLPYYYRMSDFFVTASTMETQGLVILESMSAGLPVIGVDAFAIPEIVKTGINGFIVDPTDIKSMSECMELLIRNPKLTEKLGKNAVISAKSHDIKETSALLEETYKRL